MDIVKIFFERYDPLYDFWIGGLWTDVPHDLMRQRPHPKINSIAWNLWHLTRGEDAGMNRFIADRSQVLDDGDWMDRMNLQWRHHGGETTFEEVDELDERINLTALHGYSQAVQARTREIVISLTPENLDEVLEEEHLRQILIDEGLAHSNPEAFVENYLGWSKGKCLMNLGLTHAYQHVGEIGVIATLLGVEFD
jgi:hypothetical protein